MEKLLDSYLKHIDSHLESGEIIAYEPFIEDGEQQYDVKVKSLWIPTGYENVYVSVSDLLSFMWSQTNETR